VYAAEGTLILVEETHEFGIKVAEKVNANKIGQIKT